MNAIKLAYSCSPHFKTHWTFNVFYLFKCLSKFHITINTKSFGGCSGETAEIINLCLAPYIEVFTLCSKMGVPVVVVIMKRMNICRHLNLSTLGVLNGTSTREETCGTSRPAHRARPRFPGTCRMGQFSPKLPGPVRRSPSPSR